MQKIKISALRILQEKMSKLTGISTENAIRTNEAFRELGQLGQSFSGDLGKYGNELFGTADVTLQTQIDEINAAVALATKKSLGTFSEAELLEKAKTTVDILSGKAQDIADFQQLSIDARSQELEIINKGLTLTNQELALAQSSRTTANSKLIILNKQGASDAKILEQVKAKLAAEEKIRGIKEASLLRDQDAARLSDEFNTRNKDIVTQERVKLHTAERQLQAAIDSGVASEATIQALKAEVTARERALQVTKEQAAEQEKQAHFAVANDLAGNIGSLNAGMGQMTSGLIQAAQAWDVLGTSAASSAERIQAASQVAAGFQSALGGLINAASGMVTSGIDAEIAAVKSMGLTQEQEDKKVRKLQKKKIKEEEKFAKASILLNTAMGVARALGSSPPPVNFILAGLTAAAGAMAYQQASNTAASQLASLGGSSAASAENMKIEVGSSNNLNTDISSAATSSERSQMLGDAGVFGRASAGSMRANTPYLTSESGRELIVPKTDSKIMNATDTENILAGGTGNTFAPSIHIDALDTQSVEDRIPEIMDMLQEHAEQQGFSLRR